MKITLARNLKDYRWELIEKKVRLVDKKANNSLTLDKVRLMSFMKFAPNCIDKMRIEEGKKQRARVRKVREHYIKKIKEIRLNRKKKRAKQISTKAKKVGVNRYDI